MPIMQLPDTLPSATFKVPCPEGNMFLTVCEYNSRPVQVHIMIGKSGSATMAWANLAAEFITDMLQQGIELSRIIEKVSGITTDRVRRFGEGIQIRSGPEAIAYALLQYMQGGN